MRSRQAWATYEAVWVQGGFDSDPVKLRVSAKELLSHPMRGSSAFYDAIIAATEQGLHKREGRRVLVVVSDGDDNASPGDVRGACEAAKKILRNIGVLLYILEVPVSSRTGIRTSRRVHRANVEPAESTGGRVLRIMNREEFASAFRELRHHLENQYVLSVHLPASASTGRIKIETKRKDIRVSSPNEPTLQGQ